MLSCSCDYTDFDWYAEYPDDFEVFNLNRRKRCISCQGLIDKGSDCCRFECSRDARSWVEEEIYGDKVDLADKYMCGKCGEIFLNLVSLGYCLSLGHNIKEDLEEYWEMTGFQRVVKGV